jgi:PEGA domain
VARVLARTPAVALLTACLLVAAPARSDDEAIASAASRAYADGDYAFAIQAWSQLFATDGDPEHLYDVADAHQRRHAVAGRRPDLEDAALTLRRYLATANPRAKRRAMAARQLDAVLAMLADESPAPRKPVEPTTRLGILATPLSARVQLDDGAATDLPRFASVSPGEHRISISAPGWQPLTRSITLAAGQVEAIDVALEPLAAKLVVAHAEDTELRIDGELVDSPDRLELYEVTPGRHFVSVSQNGFLPYGETLNFAAGEETTVQVDLTATGQRATSIVLLTLGGLAITTGVVFGALAVDGRRRDSPDSTIDDFRLAGGVSGLLGLGTFIAGGALYVLDEPAVPEPGSISLTLAPTNTSLRVAF